MRLPLVGAAMVAIVAIATPTSLVGAATAATPTNPAPRIAIIIDDLGHQLARAERTIALPGPVACAVIPATNYSTVVAERAHAAGKEVLLHMPMQSALPGSTRSAVTAIPINLDTTQSALDSILANELADVPHTVGVNNHQGSLITRHPGHMAWLMDALLDHGGLFFVDSYTSVQSVAFDVALEKGVPAARRDIFLDNERTPESIAHEFDRLKLEATERGYAVAIGHPYPETLAFLEAALPTLADEGFELVPVSQLVYAAKPLLSASTGMGENR